MKAKIRNFIPITPQYQTSQEKCLEWLASAHAKASTSSTDTDRFRRLLERYGCSPKQIGSRGHELPDFTHQNWKEMKLFSPETFPVGEPIERRMEIFQASAERVFREWYPSKDACDFSNLIHVSCTGYLAPSAAQIQMTNLGLGEKVQVTHAYHMGCYAAIPALRIASGFLAAGEEKAVEIAHTEQCTLHFNPANDEPEQLVVQTLFSDGFIKYVVSQDNGPGLGILAIREEQVMDTKNHMEWSPKSWGMGMTLSREVPKAIRSHLRSYLVNLFNDAGLDYERERERCQFAVHPGGPKIIDGIRDELSLRREQLAFSGKVLFDHGNMSSATLPYIWKHYLDQAEIPTGTTIVSLAFGPGLTVAGALLVKEA